MNRRVSHYRDLEVWKKAMDLVVAVYELANGLPTTERFELSSQLRRAAVSVPSNIAEGAERERTKSFIYHLSIARGSLGEVETQILIAERLGFASRTVTQPLLDAADEIGRMMRGLSNALKRRLTVDSKRKGDSTTESPM